MGPGPVRLATVVEVVMFTTDGLIWSARSAKLSGAPRAAVALCSDGLDPRQPARASVDKRPKIDVCCFTGWLS